MSSLPPDPYKALGVSQDAPLAEIRSAHRKLVLKCHPDKIQDPELKALKADEFQKVQQAYEILSDDNERQKYDDQVKMAELRRQLASKANMSSPRTVPKHAGFEIRTSEPRPSSFKNEASMPRAKTYTMYARSWDDEPSRSPRMFETEIRTGSRKETSYTEKQSKRDREKEKDRERRRRDEEEARSREKAQEKAAKESRRQEKKQREKARDKEIKRESEKKKEYAKPYLEPYDEDSSTPKSDRKKSGSKKYDEKRERSSHQDETAGPVPPPPPHPPLAAQASDNIKLDYAASYIEAARSKRSFSRSATYHASRSDKPPVPTPPMPAGQASAFPVPDDEDVRRSSARARRGSSEAPRMGREKAYRKSSRDHMDDDGIYVMHTSPKPRRSAQFDGPVPMSSSPRSGGLPRTNTMPTDAGYVRPIPPSVPRSQTFNYGDDVGSLPRGRDRSKLQAQVVESEDSEDDYEQHQRRRSERKHRSSRKQRSLSREQTTSRYQVNDGHAMFSGSYARHLPADVEFADGTRYYPTGRSSGNMRMEANRPPPSRGASYVSNHGGAKYPKVKESKSYNVEDIAYSNYTQPPYEREHQAAYA